MMDNIWILAQANNDSGGSGISSAPVTSEGEATTTQPDPGVAQEEQQQQTDQPMRSPLIQFLPFILLFVVMYMILFRGPRKKQQQHEQKKQQQKQ